MITDDAPSLRPPSVNTHSVRAAEVMHCRSCIVWKRSDVRMKDTDSIIPNELSDEVMLSDLQQMLDEELAKPENERDLDAVRDITAAIVELSDVKIPSPPSVDDIMNKAAEKKRKKIGHIRRWVTALSACFVAGIALNCYTLATYGENIIEAVLRRTRSGFTIDLSRMPHNDEREPVKPPVDDPKPTGTAWYDPLLPWLSITTETTAAPVTTETTPDNSGGTAPNKMVDYIADSIIEGCSEHGIVPFVPSELPSEMAYNGFFELKESHYEAMEDSEDMDFVFDNGNRQLFKITLEKYKSEKELPEVLIPSDNTDYLEGEERGTHVYAFPNRNRVTAVFVHENITYTITGYNISADAIMKLAYSFVPSDPDIK